jgi:hypothetical protein
VAGFYVPIELGQESIALDMAFQRIELGRHGREVRGNVFDILIGKGGDPS